MNDYWRGVLTIPAAILALVVVAALLLGVYALVVRFAPQHWALDGPGRPSDVRRLFRGINAAGRHIASFRRLVAVGPFTVYVARYRPGNVEEEAP